ncbi:MULTISPECIES: hypothetical protein [Streptomyces]|uniref:hypothetical protein n=1 Tax=Streptomyces TaxID=1883 RepID=UPI0022AAFF61|nr:hypothetical protein [Streptomyces sp. HB2AG]MCZ2524978.1 hypothetical protein [Streptomyces sp. HB2AG]
MRARRILTPLAFSLALAGLGASAAQAAPSQVTPQECIEAGGRVVNLSAEVSICVGGSLSGEVIEPGSVNNETDTGTGVGTDTAAGAGAEAGTGAETGVGTENGAGTENGTGTEAGVGTENGIGAGSAGVGQDGTAV